MDQSRGKSFAANFKFLSNCLNVKWIHFPDPSKQKQQSLSGLIQEQILLIQEYSSDPTPASSSRALMLHNGFVSLRFTPVSICHYRLSARGPRGFVFKAWTSTKTTEPIRNLIGSLWMNNLCSPSATTIEIYKIRKEMVFRAVYICSRFLGC